MWDHLLYNLNPQIKKKKKEKKSDFVLTFYYSIVSPKNQNENTCRSVLSLFGYQKWKMLFFFNIEIVKFVVDGS